MGTRKVNWQHENANPFDAIAAPAKTTKGKVTKIAAVVTDEIKNAVDTFINKKAELAKVEAEVKDLDGKIITHVREQQERLARAGNYSKSFEVKGMTGCLTYTTSDKFSTPKDPEEQTSLKSLLGERFDEMFAKKRTITLKAAVQSDAGFLQKFAKALADAGINLGETFDVVDVLEAKDDLDKNQYELTPREYEVFKTLVRQNKPSLR
jgi:hypothetical protein